MGLVERSEDTQKKAAVVTVAGEVALNSRQWNKYPGLVQNSDALDMNSLYYNR